MAKNARGDEGFTMEILPCPYFSSCKSYTPEATFV